MSKLAYVAAGSLLMGAALGYSGAVCFRSPETPVAVDENIPEKRAAIANTGDAATIAALEARIRALSAALAASQQVAKVEAPEPVMKGPKPPSGMPEMKFKADGRPDFKAMRDEFKKTHPEEFAKMEKAMARREAARRERTVARKDYLSAVNTENWSSEAKKNHEAYIAAIEEQEALREKMHSEELTDEDRDQVREQEHELRETIRTLQETERQNLLAETATSLGLSSEDAVSLIETVQDIYDATASKGDRGGPPPDAAGGPGGGMPPPGM